MLKLFSSQLSPSFPAYSTLSFSLGIMVLWAVLLLLMSSNKKEMKSH